MELSECAIRTIIRPRISLRSIRATLAERAPFPANCDSRNSVPVVAQRGQLRGPVIAAVAKKVIAALKTAERPRLAMFNAEVEPQTIRLGRMCVLAGGGRMVRIRIVEVIVA